MLRMFKTSINNIGHSDNALLKLYKCHLLSALCFVSNNDFHNVCMLVEIANTAPDG